MHERGAISSVVVDLLNEVGDGPVRDVAIEIAPDISVDVAAAAWSSATEDTPAADANVAWVRSLHEMRCFECGEVYRGDRLDPCPKCGGNGLVVKAAPEARLAWWSAGAA